MSNIVSEGLAASGPTRAQKLYFATWRWHFYAGLDVIPFLIMLATTGIFITWFTAIAPEYGERIAVTPQATTLSLPIQEAAALATHPDGKLGQYIAPFDAQTPALFRIDLDEGARMIALNPYTGAVLQDRDNAGTWNEVMTHIHGELYIGDNGGFGDVLIEIAASLGLLMIVTGVYLAWPRNGSGLRAMLVPNLAAKGRAWWKSLHQVLGVWTSLYLVFFLISGLAWAGVWGGKFVQAWSTFPAEKWDNVPLSDSTHASMNHTAQETVPWALEQTPLPQSGSAAGIAGLPAGTPVDLGAVVALGRAIGFDGRFQVAIPATETGVWTLSRDSMSYDSSSPTADRTVHVDQYTGKILAEVGYADYSAAGKAMAVGIALHEGQMGLWSVILNIGFCLVILFVAISGAVMWWKRRPVGAGRLAAPPLPAEVPFAKGALALGLSFSMAFPVLGLTLIAILVIDVIVLGSLPALRRALS